MAPRLHALLLQPAAGLVLRFGVWRVGSIPHDFKSGKCTSNSSGWALG
jgi:hypothetical protein